MLKDDLKQKIMAINETLDIKQLNLMLEPILMTGMRRGYEAAYLLIIGLSEGVQPDDQPATWIDQVEHTADKEFAKLITNVHENDSQQNEVATEINSMLAEEYHAITSHHDNQLVVESVIMPYFNGWFLGYYHALLTLVVETQAAKDTQSEGLKQQISNQAMQAVENERTKFQHQMFYQDGVLRDILSVLEPR